MIKTLDNLKNVLRQFADDRDWEQFHSPKNLAMALGVEVAELTEHFQWLTQKESLNLKAKKKEAVSAELADVLIYLVRLADRLDVNLLTAAEKKIAVNGEKYPVNESRGRSDRPDTSGETS